MYEWISLSLSCFFLPQDTYGCGRMYYSWFFSYNDMQLYENIIFQPVAMLILSVKCVHAYGVILVLWLHREGAQKATWDPIVLRSRRNRRRRSNPPH